MKSTDTEQPNAKNLLLLDQQLCFALYSANLALHKVDPGRALEGGRQQNLFC